MKYIILVILLVSSLAQATQDSSTTVCRGTVFTNATVLSSAGSLVLSARGSRRCMECQNKDASNPVYAVFDSTNVSQQGIKIIGGGSWSPQIVPTNAIYMSSTGGSVSVFCYEGVYP